MTKFYFQQVDQSVGKDQSFLVEVWFASRDQKINAIEGNILLDENLILEQILETETTISLWIEKPQLKDDKIIFAGIIPGGLEEKAKIFTLKLKSKESGEALISFNNLKALINDGYGTEDKVISENLKINIKAKTLVQEEKFIDEIPPRILEYQITKIPEIYGNKWVLVFRGIDKESGIDHYEIKEDENFYPAESPYLIKNQLLNKPIFLKVIDKFNNETIVKISPQRPYLQIEYLFLIFVILFFILFALKFKKWREKRL